jgi:hypothetical protein
VAPGGLPQPWADIDNAEAEANAVRHVAERGYTRVLGQIEHGHDAEPGEIVATWLREGEARPLASDARRGKPTARAAGADALEMPIPGCGFRTGFSR